MANYSFISSAAELHDLLHRLQDAPTIAFDTEFISEDRYYPQLCLIQIAAGQLHALIDPLSVGNLNAFWELLCDGQHEIIVHACRSEMDFCYRAAGRMPPRLFDVQIAAGFLGSSYPTGFGNILSQYLNISLPKTESRTVWNKRPLTPLQIEYALGDVLHLEELSKLLQNSLAERGRLNWCLEEINRVKLFLQNSFETPRWRFLPKSSSLNPRELAILREIWFWREEWAKKRNVLSSRILRDDLLVELARRGTSDEKRIVAVRGFQRSDAHRIVPEISAAIQRALELPVTELPPMSDRLSFPQYTVMAQFLYSALCLICKQNNISPQLVGGPGDVRELIAAEIGTLPWEIKPRLREGWRAELVSSQLDDILCGRMAVRLNLKTPDDPLIFS